MKVEQLMSKDPCVCAKSGTLNDAAKIMWETDCGMVPVTERRDGIDRLVGVVTDRDLSMAAYTSGQALKELPIERAMTKELWTCTPNDSAEAAEQTMSKAQIRRLPVVDGAGAILGVLSLADIAREAERERGRKSPDVTEAEVGATLGAITQRRPAVAV